MSVVARAMELRDLARAEDKAQRDENLLHDQVWCVFDRDEHPRFEEACARAEQEDLRVALSNPCFELWPLLHLEAQTERLHRHDLQRKVTKLLKLANPKSLPLEKFHHGYQDAVDRARELRKTAACTERPRGNPTTNVDELTEQIREGGQP